jgi:hypothetical protein
LSGDGTIVAVGIPRGNGYAGLTRVHRWNDSTSSCIRLGDDVVGDESGDFSGMSFSLLGDGEIVAIGALKNRGVNGDNSGHVKVHRWIESISTWIQLGDDIDGEGEFDRSGESVSLSGDGKAVAIGGVNEENLNSQINVYELQLEELFYM